jgi:hypothetical protein
VNAASQSDYFYTQLTGMEFAGLGWVRVKGLAIGVKFGEETEYASTPTGAKRRAYW